jgi:2-oxoglutarate dehydrogenase E1 component
MNGGFEQVTDVQMLEKVDTSYSKVGQHRLLMLFVFTNGQKFINKIQKLINDRKQCFRYKQA